RKRVSSLTRVLPAFFLLGAGHQVIAQEARWSDPATWPDNKLPVAGDSVEIASGKQVLLDVSPPVLGGLTINGQLTFEDNGDRERRPALHAQGHDHAHR